MRSKYVKLMNRARSIASRYGDADFYVTFKAELSQSRKTFFSDPLMGQLREEAKGMLGDDLGHGIGHATAVALDAGALMLVEARSRVSPLDELQRLVVLAQIAGLLHDVERGEPDHAAVGANTAAWILGDFSLTRKERAHIVRAIANHEAFGRNVELEDAEGQLISDCLYDADKFRWGPDNFTHTVWRMMDHRGYSIEEIIEIYPSGMEGIEKIKETFRTEIGRQYGPEIIDIGIEIGNEIYRFLLDYLAKGERL